MNRRPSRWLAMLVAASISYAGALQTAQAALIGTEQVAAAQGMVAADAGAAEQRARLNALLERADVVAALTERGVDVGQARERVAALADAEVAMLARHIDEAPAGAADILGTVVFIFVLLLVTDIIGFTKVFPFTRSIR
ncbi:PA2779 family protein [Caldimonas tepidiphila]|uniref:PA2779 family protein n=1 Tax=Caldimonas tepidiphila TaxID=2315841 RepID=UPI000E5B160B|nr:PA2779 family protein [Caldimonas tepidiphila]